jgi:hypothetical protein
MTLSRVMYINILAASDYNSGKLRAPRNEKVAAVYNSAYGALYALDECIGAKTA